MAKLLKTLSVATLIALSGPVLAQENTDATPAPQDSQTQAAPADPALSMGEAVDTTRQPGVPYVDEVFGDWERKCVLNPEGDDPCQIYQLVKDSTGAPTAEISLVALPAGQQAAAGATVVVPLETMLTQQLTIDVDGNNPRRYPFRFCAKIGCFAQIGLTAAEIEGFQRGAVAHMTIVPAAAPDQTVVLNVSLSGFTAAYESLPVLAEGN